MSVVQLGQVRTFLNVQGSSNDTQIQAFIDSAEAMWTGRVGPIDPTTTYDEWYDGGNTTIVLRHTPVLTVTSIVESYGSNYTRTLTAQQPDSGSGDAFGYSLDLITGEIIRRATGVAVQFATGAKNIHVVYAAGYAAAPADIVEAISLLVDHKMKAIRGGMPDALSQRQDVETISPAYNYAWPHRVQEIADTYYTPGIA